MDRLYRKLDKEKLIKFIQEKAEYLFKNNINDSIKFKSTEMGLFVRIKVTNGLVSSVTVIDNKSHKRYFTSLTGLALIDRFIDAVNNNIDKLGDLEVRQSSSDIQVDMIYNVNLDLIEVSSDLAMNSARTTLELDQVLKLRQLLASIPKENKPETIEIEVYDSYFIHNNKLYSVYKPTKAVVDVLTGKHPDKDIYNRILSKYKLINN